MNTFANSLFELLFGWLRSLVKAIWEAVSGGSLSGFFTWLGDHWLWVAIIAVIAGTLLDFIIWLIRWRPYLVWQTKWRRMIRRIRYGKEDDQARQHFYQGYQEAVPLDVPQEEYASPAWQEEAAFAWADAPASLWEEETPQAPEYPENDAQNGNAFSAAYFNQPEPAYAPPRMEYAYPADEKQPEPQYFAKPQGYEPPPVNLSTRVHGGMASDMPAARRKRRSDKYDKQKASWRQRLISDPDDDNDLLEGLPPVVDKKQAFHQPVYPQGSNQAYAAWQRPGAQNQGMDQ